jgi:arylsulfatase A-like enzyme
VALLLAALSATFWVAASSSFFRHVRARLQRPYVVLVSLDTLHVDYTSPYNEAIHNTPNLDRLAREGVTFRRAYTRVPVTLPAHASLLTSVGAPELGVFANGDVLPMGWSTLAERFRAAGYRTAAFVSLGVLRATFGLDRGFEEYDEGPLAEGTRRYRRADEVIASVDGWLDRWNGEPFFLWVHLSDPHEPYVTDDTPPDTGLFLDGQSLGAFHLARTEPVDLRIRVLPGVHRLRWESIRRPRWDDLPETKLRLRLFDERMLDPFTDSPLPSPAEEISLDPRLELVLRNPNKEPVEIPLSFGGRLSAPSPSEVAENYSRLVEAADHGLGRLSRRLESLGIGERTTWVVVSDHGEGLYRKGALGHAEFVFEDQLRVMWLFKGPAIPQGVVVDEGPVWLEDVGATLLDLLGWAPPAGIEGRSMAPCWRKSGKCSPRREPWWAYGIDHERRRLTALAGYDWPYKWLWRRGQGRSSYALDRDPREMHDLLQLSSADESPHAIKELAESFFEKRRTLLERLRGVKAPSANDDAREVLRSLGYIGR